MSGPAYPPDLHSFPTRRSSDLEVLERSLGIGSRQLDMRVVYDVAHNIAKEEDHDVDGVRRRLLVHRKGATRADRKSTRLNSSHQIISYAVFCLKKKNHQNYVHA